MQLGQLKRSPNCLKICLLKISLNEHTWGVVYEKTFETLNNYQHPAELKVSKAAEPDGIPLIIPKR